MMPRKFERILDDCLSRMDRGGSLIDILACYPSQAENLKPLIHAAMLSRSVPQPVPGYTALRVGKNQLLAEMASIQEEGGFLEPKAVQPPRERIVDRWIGFLKILQPAYRFAMLSLVVVLTGGFFTLSASATGLADNIMNTLYYSFEQVSDLLLVKPLPPKTIGEYPIFTNDYSLPDSPLDYSGEYKSFVVEEEKKGNNEHGQHGNEDASRIYTRQYSLNQKAEKSEDQEGLVLESNLVIEEINEEEAMKEEEKEEDKAAKEEEKEEDKAAKEEEKEEDKKDKKDK